MPGTETTKDVAFVEHHLHPSDTVTIIERYIPAKPGEYAPVLFGTWATGYKPMKLESRRIIDAED